MANNAGNNSPDDAMTQDVGKNGDLPNPPPGNSNGPDNENNSGSGSDPPSRPTHSFPTPLFDVLQPSDYDFFLEYVRALKNPRHRG